MNDLNAIIDRAHERSYQALPKGDTFKDLSTVIVTPIRGRKVETGETECPSCGEHVEYEKTVHTGFTPLVVESWKRMIRPMNQPIYDMLIEGREVGDAYQIAVDTILNHPQLGTYKYVLFLEDDVVLPYQPGTKGPLWQLFERIADGYDVANGLYWTKGDVSMPLIFGDTALGSTNFECLTTGWEPGDVVECNGSGMGFSLWKLDIFRDKRFEAPWFKTVEEVGVGLMTQDLYAYRKIRELGYRVCVDTGIRCGHFNTHDGEVY
jgi:hypothetical protein